MDSYRISKITRINPIAVKPERQLACDSQYKDSNRVFCFLSGYPCLYTGYEGVCCNFRKAPQGEPEQARQSDIGMDGFIDGERLR
jgi:hypothetical protein